MIVITQQVFELRLLYGLSCGILQCSDRPVLPRGLQVNNNNKKNTICKHFVLVSCFLLVLVLLLGSHARVNYLLPGMVGAQLFQCNKVFRFMVFGFVNMKAGKTTTHASISSFPQFFSIKSRMMFCFQFIKLCGLQFVAN